MAYQSAMIVSQINQELMLSQTHFQVKALHERPGPDSALGYRVS